MENGIANAVVWKTNDDPDIEPRWTLVPPAEVPDFVKNVSAMDVLLRGGGIQEVATGTWYKAEFTVDAQERLNAQARQRPN